MLMEMLAGDRLGDRVYRDQRRAGEAEQNPRDETQPGVNTGLPDVPFDQIASAGDEEFTGNLDTSPQSLVVLSLTAHLRYLQLQTKIPHRADDPRVVSFW